MKSLFQEIPKSKRFVFYEAANWAILGERGQNSEKGRNIANLN